MSGATPVAFRQRRPSGSVRVIAAKLCATVWRLLRGRRRGRPFGSGRSETWAIVDGKLYLNADKAGLEEWRKDVAANIAKADQQWANLDKN